MDSSTYRYGFTLVEMLVVVAVIMLLAGLTIGIGSHLDTQSKERAVKSTFAVLEAALERFYDYEYRYAHPAYAGFRFPLDCTDFDRAGLEATLRDALGAGIVEIIGVDDTGVEHAAIDFKIEDSGCAAMCFFLNRLPESRETLDKIDDSRITNEGTANSGAVKVRMTVRIDGRGYPLLRVVDPWGKTLRYDYYDELVLDPDLRYRGRKTFPVIASAGPDRVFDTADDITSR